LSAFAAKGIRELLHPSQHGARHHQVELDTPQALVNVLENNGAQYLVLVNDHRAYDERTGKYKVITWPTFGGADAAVTFNQTYTGDPEMGKLMATREFRVALSHAINRDQIEQTVQDVRPKLFIFKPEDDDTLKLLKELFPNRVIRNQ
jgi:hypothetical protein